MRFFLKSCAIYFNYNLTQDVKLLSEVPMPAKCFCKAIDISAFVLKQEIEAKVTKKKKLSTTKDNC